MIVITLAVIPLRSGPPSTMHSRVPANHAVSPAVLPAVSPGGSGLAGDVGDDAGDVVRGAVRGQGDQVGAGLGALHAGRALVAALADPDQGWEAIVIGELCRLL